MDIIFIPTKYKSLELNNIDYLKKILPKKFTLVSIKQYEEHSKKLYEILKKDFNITIKEDLYGINVLGCYSEPANTEDNTILLIGNGKFHAENIVRIYKKKVIVYDPIYGTINIIEPNEDYDKKIYYLLNKLKNAKNIGIIISIKPGQYYYQESIKIKKILEKKGKNVYLFLSDTINFLDLKNFIYIDFWIFSACPRIIDDILDSEINGLPINEVIKNLSMVLD